MVRNQLRILLTIFIFIGIFSTIAHSSSLKWTKVSDGKLPANAWHKSVVFKDKMWIAGGLGGSSGGNIKLFASSDGVEWETVMDKVPFPQRHHHGFAVFKDNMYILNGTLAN